MAGGVVGGAVCHRLLAYLALAAAGRAGQGEPPDAPQSALLAGGCGGPVAAECFDDDGRLELLQRFATEHEAPSPLSLDSRASQRANLSARTLRGGGVRLALRAPTAGPNDCSRRGPVPEDQMPVWDGSPESFFDDYRPYADIQRYLDSLVERYPKVVTPKTIGQSWEGRELRVLEITDPSNGVPSEDKPCIFVEGGIHAREWIAPAAVMQVAAKMAQEASRPGRSAALQRYVFTFLVPVNPDGYVYTWEANRMWRKTRSNRSEYACRGVAAGVDANRNFGYTWGDTADASYARDLRDPCTEVFIGPAAFSEPETRAVANYLRRRQRRSKATGTTDASGAALPGPGYAAAFIDVHSFAQMLLPPWAFTASYPEGADGSYQTGLTTSMVRAIESAGSRKRFSAGPDLFPADPGTGPDWAYGELGVRATMTIELEPTDSWWGGGFCLDRSNIRSVGEEQIAAIGALAQYLLDHGDEPSRSYGFFAA